MTCSTRIKLKTLTPLWTGGVDGKVDRIHETAIIGSLRWWFEVFVRGLGGYACDPTSQDRCEYNPKKDPRPPEEQLCVVCYLFGSTGWARKFRLSVEETFNFEETSKKDRAIASGQTITLRFIPRQPITEVEMCLLSLTMRLISEYGALGGKTIFKPSNETKRQNEFHHKDFGLVDLQFSGETWNCFKTQDEIRAYVTSSQWRSKTHKYHDKEGKEHDYSWASLQNFWCVKGRYLARQDVQISTYNKVLGRNEDKSEKERRGKHVIRWSDFLQKRNDRASHWLAGYQQESKKVFSFKHPAEHGRTFGFVNPGLVDFGEMRKRLRKVWEDFKPDTEFKTGEQIISALFDSQSS